MKSVRERKENGGCKRKKGEGRKRKRKEKGEVLSSIGRREEEDRGSE